MPYRLGFNACLLLCCASGMQVPKPKPQPPRPPTVVSQAANPLWVDEAPPPYAKAASELWEVLCTPAICEASRLSSDLPEDTGAKMLQCMINDGWPDLKSVWKAETSAPNSEALWNLCVQSCPTDGERANLYAFVKASFDVRCPHSAPLCPPLSVSSLPSPASLQRVFAAPSSLPLPPSRAA